MATPQRKLLYDEIIKHICNKFGLIMQAHYPYDPFIYNLRIKANDMIYINFNSNGEVSLQDRSQDNESHQYILADPKFIDKLEEDILKIVDRSNKRIKHTWNHLNTKPKS